MFPLLYCKTYKLAISNFKISSIVTQQVLNCQEYAQIKATQTLSMLVIKLWRSISRPQDTEQKYLCIQTKAMDNSFQKNMVQAFLFDYQNNSEAKRQSNNQMHFRCRTLYIKLKYLCTPNEAMDNGFQKNMVQAFLDDYYQNN